MTESPKRKQSFYFPEDMLKEIKDEAARLDRSLTWIVTRAWKIARMEIAQFPGAEGDPIGILGAHVIKPKSPQS